MLKLKGLDGIRGLLAVGVALSHAYSHFTGWDTGFNIFHNADYAVDIFFVLSGIVLYHAYESRLSKNVIGSWDFIRTRIFRLYPLHLFAVLLIPLALKFSTGDYFPAWLGVITPWNIVGDLTLTNSLGIGFLPKTNIPSWSISVELVAGSALVLLCCLRRYMAFILLPVATTCVLFFNIDVKGAASGPYPLLTDGVIRCLFCMSLGICCWVLATAYSSWISRFILPCKIFISLSLMAMFLILLGIDISVYVYIPLTAAVSLSICMLPYVKFELRDFFESKTLSTLGQLSFSIYIIHTPIIYFMLKFKSENFKENILWASLAILIAIGLSVFTHKYIELPFIAYGKKRKFKEPVFSSSLNK